MLLSMRQRWIEFIRVFPDMMGALQEAEDLTWRLVVRSKRLQRMWFSDVVLSDSQRELVELSEYMYMI